MIYALLIDKTGTITTIRLKEINESDLYKKCGFKNNKDFDVRQTWCTQVNHSRLYVSLYAKNKSKTTNFENKYEFPPPVDKELYFGTCLLIAYTYPPKTDGSIKTYVSLTPDTWKSIYNTLYGGFESLADTEAADEVEPDELANISTKLLTKTGYLKDGFVIDDDYIEDVSDTETEASSIGECGDQDDSGPCSFNTLPNHKGTLRKPKAISIKPSTYIIKHIQEVTEELKLEKFV